MNDKKYVRLINKGQKLVDDGKFHQAIDVLQEILAKRPNDVETLFKLGNIARKMGMYDNAIKILMQCLQLQPNDPGILSNLGLAYKLKGDNDAAVDCYKLVLTLQPENHLMWNNLGNLMRQKQDFENAIIFLKETIRLAPDYGEAYANLSLTYADAGLIEEAIEAHHIAIKLLGDVPHIQLNHAIQMMFVGRLDAAWENYGARHDPSLPAAIEYVTDLPWWKGEDLSDKTLLVASEQGIGDQIVFASMINELIDSSKHLIVETHPKLYDIFCRSFPDAEVRVVSSITENNKTRAIYPWLAERNDVDLISPAGDALQFLRPTVESFPRTKSFLKADSEKIAYWKDRLHDLVGDKKKIGISWKSGLITGARQASYISLEYFAPFTAIDNCALISVQYKDAAEDIKQFEEKFGVEIIQIPDLDQFNDLSSTAAMYCTLDAMVGPRTASIALAGALGVPSIATSGSHFQCGVARFDPFCDSVVTLCLDEDNWRVAYMIDDQYYDKLDIYRSYLDFDQETPADVIHQQMIKIDNFYSRAEKRLGSVGGGNWKRPVRNFIGKLVPDIVESGQGNRPNEP